MAKEKICGIYKIENVTNGKLYIGSSVDIYRRWKEHTTSLNNNKHHSPHLQYSWNKHGKDNFKFEIIEICCEDELLVREQYYIDSLNVLDEKFGYNTAPYADKPFLTPNGKEKMIAINREKFKGEGSGFHKYTENDILRCIELLKTGLYTYQEISEITNVSIGVIECVRTHKSWNYLTSGMEFPKTIRNVKGNQTLSYDKVKEIIELLKEGKSNSEIAKIYGITRDAINAIRTGKSYKELTNNLELPSTRNRDFTEEEIQEIIQMLLDGKQNLYIANLFNVNKGRIAEIRNHRSYCSYTDGIVFPKGTPKQTEFSGKQKDVIEYYNSHPSTTQAEIANHFGLHQSTISSTLSKFKHLLKY